MREVEALVTASKKHGQRFVFAVAAVILITVPLVLVCDSEARRVRRVWVFASYHEGIRLHCEAHDFLPSSLDEIEAAFIARSGRVWTIDASERPSFRAIEPGSREEQPILIEPRGKWWEFWNGRNVLFVRGDCSAIRVETLDGRKFREMCHKHAIVGD